MNSILITGGAGFIGINAANHFYNIGWRVNILDNLSRHGSERNLEWIKKNSRQINFFKTDTLYLVDNSLKISIAKGVFPVPPKYILPIQIIFISRNFLVKIFFKYLLMLNRR